jgi:hypothetical protein
VVEVAGPTLARIVMGWEGPMWRYRTPTWGAWQQGEPPTENVVLYGGSVES